MFVNSEPTPYDLRFFVFGFPVRVHPMFWLMGLILVVPRGNLPGSMILALSAIGIACVFVSILVHELGHALLMRYAGVRSQIVLHAMGGHAAPSHRVASPRMNIIILFAGPAAGFLLFFLVWGIDFLLREHAPDKVNLYARFALDYLMYINLWWGIFNLLPIFPMDGGQIARTAMQSWWGFRGLVNSLLISITVCIGMILWTYQRSNYNLLSMPVILFALFCYENVQEYQQINFRGSRW